MSKRIKEREVMEYMRRSEFKSKMVLKGSSLKSLVSFKNVSLRAPQVFFHVSITSHQHRYRVTLATKTQADGKSPSFVVSAGPISKVLPYFIDRQTTPLGAHSKLAFTHRGKTSFSGFTQQSENDISFSYFLMRL